MIQSHEMPQEMVEVNGKRKYKINVQEVTKKSMEDTEVYYTYDEVEFSAAIPVEITDAKTAKLKLKVARDNINNMYEKQVKALTEETPDSEKLTWSKQEAEARAYLVDNTANTPLIDAIVTARGCDREYLVGKIIEKTNSYAIAVGALTGERQKKENEL